MPQLDLSTWPPQIIWLAITFIVLYLLMSRVALPRVATVLEQRRDRIANDLDEAARLKGETEDAVAAYEAALAEARGKAHAIASETRAKLNVELDKERAAVEAKIAEKTKQAETQIAAMKAKAMTEVDKAASETAASIIKVLIGDVASDKDIADAVAAAKNG